MTYQEKITKAKARLMLEHPYFGTIASALSLEKNNEILTFLSDGKKMAYNSEYLERLSLEEVEFVLANGAMHTVLQHQDRVAERTKWLWQTATDYVVNAMLVKNGMQLPLYANYEEKFVGMYAEEVYQHLRDEMLDNSDHSMEQEEEQVVDSDEVGVENLHAQKEDIPDDNAKESKDQQDDTRQEQSLGTSNDEDLSQEVKEQIEQIFQKLKRQDRLPEALEFVVPAYFSHRIDWREYLYSAIALHAKTSYSFSPPNKKYLYRGICLPSLGSDLLRVVVAIDTSGSIDDALLTVFLGEIDSMMQQYPHYEIDIITADAKVQSHKTFLPGEPLSYTLSGGGGTDFRPVFSFVERHIDYPSLLLYFTDGEGTFPSDAPLYDLLWIMPKEKEVPFGEVLQID